MEMSFSNVCSHVWQREGPQVRHCLWDNFNESLHWWIPHYEDTKQIPVRKLESILISSLLLNVTPHWHLKGLYSIVLNDRGNPAMSGNALCELEVFHTTFSVNILFQAIVSWPLVRFMKSWLHSSLESLP